MFLKTPRSPLSTHSLQRTDRERLPRVLLCSNLFPEFSGRKAPSPDACAAETGCPAPLLGAAEDQGCPRPAEGLVAHKSTNSNRGFLSSRTRLLTHRLSSKIAPQQPTPKFLTGGRRSLQLRPQRSVSPPSDLYQPDGPELPHLQGGRPDGPPQGRKATVGTEDSRHHSPGPRAQAHGSQATWQVPLAPGLQPAVRRGWRSQDEDRCGEQGPLWLCSSGFSYSG